MVWGLKEIGVTKDRFSWAHGGNGDATYPNGELGRRGNQEYGIVE